MKILRYAFLLLTVLAVPLFADLAMAEESLNGTVRSVDLAKRSVVVKSFSGEELTITISNDDSATMNKLGSGVIKPDDAVRVKYVVRDGKNVATFFRKTMGC